MHVRQYLCNKTMSDNFGIIFDKKKIWNNLYKQNIGFTGDTMKQVGDRRG